MHVFAELCCRSPAVAGLSLSVLIEEAALGPWKQAWWAPMAWHCLVSIRSALALADASSASAGHASAVSVHARHFQWRAPGNFPNCKATATSANPNRSNGQEVQSTQHLTPLPCYQCRFNWIALTDRIF